MAQVQLPLHPAQRDIFIDQLIDVTNPNYNVGGCLVLKGDLRVDLFKQVANSIPQNFDAFKMRFHLNIDTPYCYFDENKTFFEIIELDYSHYQSPESEARLWMQNQFNTPFVIKEESVLYEQFLIKISDTEHWHFLRCHHLLTDGYGFAIINKFIAEKYASLLLNQDFHFTSFPYKDEIAKAHQYYSSSEYESEGKYWSEKLKAKPIGVLRRNYKSNHSNEKSSRYAFKIAEPLRQALSKIQSITHASIQQLTIAALTIYYGQISEHSEFVFAIPIHKRSGKRQRNSVGMFAGVIPFKGSYQKDNTLIDFINSIVLNQRQDYRNSNYLASDLGRLVKSEQDFLFEIAINYEFFDFDVNFGSDLNASILHLSSEFQRYPLQLSWRDYGKHQDLELHIDFWNSYFTLEEIELLTRRIIFILEQFLEKLNESVNCIDLLPLQEIELLDRFGNNTTSYPQNRNVIDLFHEQARLNSNAPALLYESRQLSYNELDERSNRLAHYLRSRGIGKNSLIPVCVGRSLEMVVGILGILKAGAAYVPIDPEYPVERIGFILQDISGSICLCSAELKTKIVESHLPVECVELVSDWNIIAQHSCESINYSEPGSLVYIIYTSGSTGKPKGVMVEHRQLIDHVYGFIESANLESCRSFALFASLTADAGHSILFAALIKARILYILSDSLLVNRKDLFDYLDNYPIDCIKIVPSLWLSYADNENVLLPKKVLVFGGEKLPPNALNLLKQNQYSGEVYNHYGPTETTIGKCIYKIDLSRIYHSVPIGRPFSETSMYIMDSEIKLLPIGAIGELHIGGVGVARGYLNREELTKEKFITNPFFKEHRLYKTGDLCRWLPDGNIEYLGRRDNQVKIRGYRIELGEIEYALEKISGVQQAAVVLQSINGNSHLIGYLVSDQVVLNTRFVLAELRGRLPEYMIPSSLIQLDSLPLTNNGKLDRAALPTLELSTSSGPTYEGPRNDVEELLCNLWQDLLHVEQVSVHDNFFERGGDSLIAIRLVSAICKKFEVDFSFRDLNAHSTIAQLAEYLQKLDKGLTEPFIYVNKRPLRIPLSFGQERMWFVNQLEGSIQYQEPSVFRLKGILNKNALNYAFKTLILRHEVFRTVIRQEEGHPYQEVLPASDWMLGETLDFREKEKIDLQKKISDLIYTPFDLTRHLMLRVHLIVVGENEYILVIAVHHIASDGWSVPIIIRELAQLYTTYAEGRVCKLPPLTAQYIDYALWQRNYLKDEILDKKLAYWKLKLREVSDLDIRTDYPRPVVQSNRGAVVSFTIDAALTDQIQQLSQIEGATLYMTLLASLNVLLYQYTGSKDFCIGTPIANRTHLETAEIVGFFVNTVALRSDLNNNPSFSSLLRSIKQDVLDAHAHQDVPFEKVVEAVVKKRDVSKSPLFQVMFMMQNNEQSGLVKNLLPGLELSRERFTPSTSKFDLTFNVTSTATGLEVDINYCTDLFKEETMIRMGIYFKQLLANITREPYQQIGNYSMMSFEEESQLLSELTGPYVTNKKNNTVVDLFEEQTAKTPDEVALKYKEHSFTFHQLNEKANQLAAYLQQKYMIQPDEVVQIRLPRSEWIIIAILGVLKAGGACCPLSPEPSIGQFNRSLSHNQFKTVIDDDVLADFKKQKNNYSKRNITETCKRNNLAYIIFNGVFSDTNNGVMLEHGNLVSLFENFSKKFSLENGLVMAGITDYTVDFSIIELLGTLVNGIQLHLMDIGDSAGLSKAIHSHQVHVLQTTPAFLNELLLTDNSFLTNLKVLLISGEPLNHKLYSYLQKLSLSTHIYYQYGKVETSIWSSSLKIESDSPKSIGTHLQNQSVYLLNSHGTLCPPDVIGEIHIGGNGLARGYWNRPKLTADKFVINPFIKSERLYKTGDLGRILKDGTIEFIGNETDKVNILRSKIWLNDIEDVIEHYSQVNKAIVKTKTNNIGQQELTAYIVGEERISIPHLQLYLSKVLPSSMFPKHIIQIDNLPLLYFSILDTASLPDPELNEPETSYVAPQSPTEEMLVEIWEEVLKKKRIGVKDNFFDLGGNSMKIAKIAGLINKRFTKKISIVTAFRFPNIHALSEYIDKESKQVVAESDEDMTMSAAMMEQTINLFNDEAGV